MSDFSSGWARVIARGDEHRNRVGKIVSEDEDSAGVWVTLQIEDEEIIFYAHELAPCTAPLNSGVTI